LLEDAGFTDVREHRVGASTGFPELFGDVMAFESESTPNCPHTLIVEATVRRTRGEAP
jgi:hypothetical protein